MSARLTRGANATPARFMRIGIDARELCGKPTGVGRHLAGLLDGWRAGSFIGRHTWILYAPGEIDIPLPPAAKTRLVEGSGGTRWEQLSLPQVARRDMLDVFFAPGYSGPLALTVPSVVLIHDLSFLSHPEWFGFREGLRRRLLTRWSAAKARAILAVSDAARNEIINQLGLPPDRVRRIYPGVTPLARVRATGSDPYVLYAGSIFNRRRLPDLIRAFREIARDHPNARLDIVGDNRSCPYQDLSAMINAEGIASQATVHSYVPDAMLADMYARARAFAFLSEYEGFGHPPLEALAVGVPPVLLDTAVARETCGDAALYVKPGDVRAIADGLRRLLFDESTRARLLGAAPSVLERYSWPRAAAETLEVLECAI